MVTALVRNELFAIHNKLDSIAYTVLIKLVCKDPSTTVVTLDLSILTKSRSFSLTLPLLKQLASNELKTDLRTLKVVETKIGQ